MVGDERRCFIAIAFQLVYDMLGGRVKESSGWEVGVGGGGNSVELDT